MSAPDTGSNLPDFLKKLIHRGINALGFQLVKKTRKNEVRLPLLAARNLLQQDGRQPVMFDVGANAGQTTRSMLELFPGAMIHAFEPGSRAFDQLRTNLADLPNVHLHHKAMGSAPGSISLNENEESTMSSVLPLGESGWGRIQEVREVELTTVDEVCRQHNIQHLSILKSDTQGYDMEVMRGAAGMMESGRLDCVFFELIFSDLYQGMPRFDKVFSFLLDRDYVLVSVYDIHLKNGVAGWADVLFVHRRVLQGRTK